MTARALAGAPRQGARPARGNSARVVLLVSLAGLLLVIAVAVFAPGAEDDPTPATWNTGKAGAKAALLLLSALGYRAAASERPLTELSALSAEKAARTTLILAEAGADPGLPVDELKADRAALAAFLKRGGSVLATGLAGATLLDRAEVRVSTRMFQGLCLTTPEGRSPLARAGSVALAVPVSWAGDPSTQVSVAQRCGQEAVVTRWRVGAGTATWWSSSKPLSNQGLHNEASLRLLLASVSPFDGAGLRPIDRAGKPGQIILFDESLHALGSAHLASPLQGLPLPLLLAQAGLVAALLLFSFSRRHGPVRPARTPSGVYGAPARTSPLEFAYSMGALYHRAGATSAPLEAAERRLHRVLATAAGLPQAVLRAGPAAIGGALRARFGEQDAWDVLERDLTRAQAAGDRPAPGPAIPGPPIPGPPIQEALAIVRALDAHAAALPRQIGSDRSAAQQP